MLRHSCSFEVLSSADANGGAKCIGLLSLISADCDTVPAMNKKARDFHADAQQTLEELGFVVFRPDGPTRTPDEAISHIRALEDAGAETLVMYVADWSYSTTAAWSALLSNGLPVILWTNARPDCAGLIGAGVTKGGLSEVGIEAPLVYGNFDDEPTRNLLRTLCNGFAAGRRLRGMRYGLGGSRSLHMLTASIDPNQWLTQFGIDADGWDELDVAERSKSVDEKDVARYRDWLGSEFGRVDASGIVVEMSIRLYAALKEVIAEKGFDFISVKCLPVMAQAATSWCMSHALLGDASDADGPKPRMVCACEADSNGALTMQMMKNVDDQAINFADLRWMDSEEAVIRISNCGSQATELAPSRKDVHWVKHGLQEIPWKHGGMCPQYICKPGRVTLARLSRVLGRHVMLIAGGECQDKPREALDTTHWEFSPHAWVKLDAPAQAFANVVRSNHIHMMYGDWREDLKHLCASLDIEPIAPRGE